MKNIVVGLLLGIALLIAACSKYPDGPEVSFTSRKARLVNNWKVDQSFRNNVQDTATTNGLLEFKDNGDYQGYIFNTPQNKFDTLTGTWRFVDSDASVQVEFKRNTDTTTRYQNWKILRLMEDELWVETNNFGATWTKYHLKPNE